MEKIFSLVETLAKIASNYQHLDGLTFRDSAVFSWDYTVRVIQYDPQAEGADKYLLHEFSHALLNHQSYRRDIDLIKIERDAWHEAVAVAKTIGITLDQEFIDEALDTYRDWIHDRSLCPDCGTTGVQIQQHTYQCLSCSTSWTVNEARSCALRRYKTKKRP